MSSDDRRQRMSKIIGGFGVSTIMGVQGYMLRKMTQEKGFQTGMMGLMRNLTSVRSAPRPVQIATGVMVGMGTLIGHVTQRRKALTDEVKSRL